MTTQEMKLNWDDFCPFNCNDRAVELLIQKNIKLVAPKGIKKNDLAYALLELTAYKNQKKVLYDVTDAGYQITESDLVDIVETDGFVPIAGDMLNLYKGEFSKEAAYKLCANQDAPVRKILRRTPKNVEFSTAEVIDILGYEPELSGIEKLLDHFHPSTMNLMDMNELFATTPPFIHQRLRKFIDLLPFQDQVEIETEGNFCIAWGDRLLAESENYYILGNEESTELYRKKDNARVTSVGDFYGNAEDAIIDIHERFCVAVGCGVVVYLLKQPFKDYEYDQECDQWYEFGRDPQDALWVDCVSQIGDDEIELVREDGTRMRLKVNLNHHKYSDEECRVLEYKAIHPDEVVLCPRCGKPLIFYDYGSAYEVKCETEDCLHETVRGL